MPSLNSNLTRIHMQKIVELLQNSETNDNPKIRDIAKIIGLSVRTIQRYISDLEKLNIVTRYSDGSVSLNEDYVKILDDLGYDPRQLKLDDFLLVREYVDPILSLEDHVLDVLRKIKAPLVALPKVRDELLRLSPSQVEMKNLIGNRLLYPNFASNSYVTTNMLGIAANAKKTLLHIRNYYCFYLACVAASTWYVQLRKGEIADDRGFMVKPDFRRIREERLPLRELFTEFPGLKKISYGLVLHYLAQTTLYQLAIEALNAYGNDIEIFFRLGSLVPHGFYSVASDRDASFRKLKLEFLQTFNEFTRLARSLGVVVCGVSIEPRDDWFSRLVIKPLMAENSEISLKDHFVLNLIMEEKDATCLIQRKEKGKNLDNYEFYMKNQHTISKYEFLDLNNKNPIDLQKRIAEIAYNTCNPFPFRFITESNYFKMPIKRKTQLMAPFVCHEALHNASIYAAKLEKHAKIAFEYGMEKLEDELYREGIRNSDL